MIEKDIQVVYLTPNPYSRPRRPLRKVRGIVIHWVANPGTSALFNREYFELRKNGKHKYGSAHYIIGLGGEIAQCVPFTEMAYHAGPTAKTTPWAKEKFGAMPNNCTIGIELCHVDWAGRFTPATLDSAIELCAGLADHFDLEPLEDITTHYAVAKKVTVVGPCPRWFVDHPDEFGQFKQDVHHRLLERFA